MNRAGIIWGLAGVGFVGLFTGLSAFSSGFAYGRSNLEKPILPLVFFLTISGALYFFLVLRFRPLPPGKFWSGFVFLAGLLARFVLFPSAPILEDDSYRYLWEGGMVARGFDPYRYSVQEVLAPQSRDVPERLVALAEEAAPIPSRVNHPWLKTIYPPLSQSAFALAHLLTPWDLAGWRFLLLAADLLNLFLLFLLLRRLDLPPSGWVIYWWNPLLIKETYNSGHLELILVPFILGALLLCIRGRYLAAAGALGLGVGVKLWPVILLPAVLRPILREPKRFGPPLLVFVCLSLLMVLPFLFGGWDSRSGLLAYLSHWEMNDSLFLLLLWFSQITVLLLGADPGNVPLLARIAAFCFFGAWSFSLLKKPVRKPGDSATLFLLLPAGLFLVSPAQFPWYFLWVLPFLVLQPRPSLLLLTALLPLYYLRFHLEARGAAVFFDRYLVWLQFAPVWGLLVWEWKRGGRTRA